MKGRKDEDAEEMNPLNTIFKSVVPSSELLRQAEVWFYTVKFKLITKWFRAKLLETWCICIVIYN